MTEVAGEVASGWEPVTKAFRTTSPMAERKLKALSEVGRTIVSGADYGQVLAALIEKVDRLVDAESGGIMLFDEVSGQLQLQRPAFGLDSDEQIDAYRVPLTAGGNAVTVFVTGQPHLTNDAPDEPRNLQQFVRLHRARRILTVPLQVEGRSIGVFHAINKRSGDFTAEDLELMQLIAPQLAVMIQAAAMVRSLRSQELELENLLKIHNALTEMAIGGHDLVDLANRLSELMGAEVVVLELGGEPVWARGHSRASQPEIAQILTRLAERSPNDHGPEYAALPDGRSAGGVPILASGEVLGSIVAVSSRQSPTVVRALQQAALVLALAIVTGRQVADLERRLRADALAHLAIAETQAEVSSLYRRLGLVPDEPVRAAKVVRSRAHATGDQARLHRIFAQLLERDWPGGVPVVSADGITLLLPIRSLPGADQRRRLERFAAAARGALPAGRPEVFAVGSAGRGSEGLKRSLKDADMVIAAGHLFPKPSVIFVEDMGLVRLLAQPAESEDVQQFVEATLGPLDPTAGNGYRDWMPFLEALVASNFSVKQAARSLGIHLNTARYRAARIQEKLGVEFGDAEARLNLMVALRLRHVLAHK